MDEISELITQSQQKDKEAFGKLYLIFYKRIFRYCSLNLRSDVLAQDICQETFLRAWKHIASFSLKKGGSFQAFLFRIARNLVIDQTRKKKEVSLEGYEDLEGTEDFEGEIDRGAKVLKLKFALSKLTEIERQIVVLHYFEDLSHREIAKVLKLREGAIRVRSHRVISKLKEMLNDTK